MPFFYMQLLSSEKKVGDTPPPSVSPNSTEKLKESFFRSSNLFLTAAATIIIIFAIGITAAVQGPSGEPFSQVITVGPVWNTNTWLCTSDAEFMVHAILIGYADDSGLTIFQSGAGTQPDFIFTPREMQSFSLGGIADSTIRITNVGGTVSGFITLQTANGATANCEQV